MIEVINLSKKFRNKLIFEDVNLKFSQGNIYGFIGPNGVGKSVFFKTISGLIKASEGSVIVNGKVIRRDIGFIPNLGYMDNDASFIEDISGFQNLKLLASINNKIDDNIILNLMKRLKLDPSSNIKVKNYSLGMRQKLSIIQAIMENPDVVILDEPFNGVDKESVLIIKEIISELKHDNKIILLTSHIVSDIGEIADFSYEFSDFSIRKV